MVIINKRPWAVGLDWSSSRMEKLSKIQLLQKAQRIDPDFDVMALQRRLYGFGSSGGRPEDWSKARSLAAFLELPPAFLGLFALEDVNGVVFWWVICRQNGQNVGQGDAVYKTQHEAEQELRSLNELLDNSIEDVFISKDPSESLSWLEPLLHVGALSYLNQKARLTNLQPSSASPIPWVGIGIAFFCCCIAGVALNAWFEKQAERESAEAARIARLDAEQRKNYLLEHPETQFPQPWFDEPLASAQATVCLTHMLALPLVVNGWLIGDADCVKKSLSVTWEHQPQADFLQLPFNGTLKTPQQAVSRHSLPELVTPRKSQKFPNLLTQLVASQYLYQLTQDVGGKLRLMFQPPERKTVQKIEVLAPWNKGEWELSLVPGSVIRNEEFWNSLSDIPGLTLEKVSYKHELWSMQGRIYAKGK